MNAAQGIWFQPRLTPTSFNVPITPLDSTRLFIETPTSQGGKDPSGQFKIPQTSGATTFPVVQLQPAPHSNEKGQLRHSAPQQTEDSEGKESSANSSEISLIPSPSPLVNPVYAIWSPYTSQYMMMPMPMMMPVPMMGNIIHAASDGTKNASPTRMVDPSNLYVHGQVPHDAKNHEFKHSNDDGSESFKHGQNAGLQNEHMASQRDMRTAGPREHFAVPSPTTLAPVATRTDNALRNQETREEEAVNILATIKNHSSDSSPQTPTLSGPIPISPPPEKEIANKFPEGSKKRPLQAIERGSNQFNISFDAFPDQPEPVLHKPSRRWKCPMCQRDFKLAKHCKRHIRSHSSIREICESCHKLFGRKDSLVRHMRRCHGITNI